MIGGVIQGGLVNLYVADIETSIAFYGGHLGLAETFRTPTEGTPEHVEYAAGGLTLGLGSVDAARRAHGVEATPGAPAMAVVFWCDGPGEPDATYARLLSAGVIGDAEPHDTGNGNRNARVRDPDGTLVELVAKMGLTPIGIREDAGLPVFDVAADASAITFEHVARALDEE